LKGLEALDGLAQDDDWVLVHDIARPCVRLSDIERLVTAVRQHPVGGLLASPVRDTMKRADRSGTVVGTVDREGLWHALTPQMFRYGLLRRALNEGIANGLAMTDESSAIEAFGQAPLLVEGAADNIKITHPQDLALAALFLQQRQAQAQQ
jgi:2-C-methyl-D-erythritol 4-phosphate cytidylyltransferase